MSEVLLDTNVLIDLVFERSEILSRRFSAAAAGGDSLHLSAISLYEYRFGAERSRRRAYQLEALERFLSVVAIVDFGSEDAERMALIKADLAARGTMIGSYDLLIAAQAATRTLTVVTGNLREFSRIPGLTVEDWSSGA